MRCFLITAATMLLISIGGGAQAGELYAPQAQLVNYTQILRHENLLAIYDCKTGTACS